MTHLEVALAGFILLSIAAMIATLGKKTQRLRFALFGVTCLSYLCFLIWHQPAALNTRNAAIVLMAITWTIYETLGEGSRLNEGSMGFEPLNFMKNVVVIFLATGPILLVIVDRERTQIGLVEGLGIGFWSVGLIFKTRKYKFNKTDSNRVGTYLIVWSYYLYALGTNGGMIAIFAPFLILGHLFKTPHLIGNGNIFHEI